MAPRFATAHIPVEEREAKRAALQQERDQVFGAEARRSNSALYEVSAIRKEYIVLSSGAQERFIAKSAVRMIIRNLPTVSVDATK